MKREFTNPSKTLLEFTKNIDGVIRKPLLIPRVTSIVFGGKIIVTFLAKDNKEHRHKYPARYIQRITVDNILVIYDRSKINKHHN